MKKKDIFGLIGLDLIREKKPKKRLDDILLGDDDEQPEEFMQKKKKPQEEPAKKKSVLDIAIGASPSEQAASKPNVKPLEWDKLNAMNPRDQIKTLKREYLSLYDKMEELGSKYVEEQSGKAEKSIEVEKLKKEITMIREYLREIVDFIPDAYDLKMQMDTSAWNVSDIHVELTSKMKSLVTKVKFADKALEAETKDIQAQKKLLENELQRARHRIEELERHSSSGSSDTVYETKPYQEYEANETTSTSSSPFGQTTRHEETHTTKPSTSSFGSDTPNKPVQRREEQKPLVIPDIPDDVPKYVFLDVDRYIEDLNDESMFILKVIGQTGVSRNSEMKSYLEEDDLGKKYFFPNGKYNNNDLNAAVKTLKDRQMLNSTNVKLGAKGGYDFSVYELSDIGKAIYYKATNLQPVEPEMAQILRDHKTLEHGYLIKECAIEFKAMGYKVYEDRESCTYKLNNGKRKVFDLIIEMDGKKMHIEVERGTHTTDGFFEAMDKIYQVTNEFYFVAPNQKILYNETKGKVFKWITDRLGGFDNAKGKIKMNFATFENIKKRVKNVWEVFEL